MIHFSCSRRSRPLTISIIAALVSLLLSSLARGGQQDFPPATALEQGLSPAALGRVDELVGTLVDEGEVVGAELLIIQGGRTVLHSAHGWRDEEAQGGCGEQAPIRRARRLMGWEGGYFLRSEIKKERDA